jgi:hypothetical protein
MLNITLPDSFGIAVHQDLYGGHYRKENGLPCNDVMEIYTSNSR